jgi:hypothetical protein
MKRTLSVLFVAVVALLSLLGTASAEPGAAPVNRPVTVYAPVQNDVSVQALSCTSGNMCAWPVSDGSRNRCSWGNADNDWQTAPVTCSWSSSSAVWAVYGGNIAYYVARGQQADGFPGVKIRSHKWVTNGWCF